MSRNRHTFDDKSPFGTYRPGIFAHGLIKVTRRLPTNWLGRRLMFILRHFAALGVSGKVDIELFPEENVWFDKVKIKDEQFQKDKDDYVQAKGNWIEKERAAGRFTGLD